MTDGIKWLIASDIHGSALYCRELADAYRREKADRLLLLGDILYHGPRNDLPSGYDPKETSRILNELSSDIMCVRGNCEAEVDQLMLDFPIMADYALISFGRNVIFATHGHLYNNDRLPPLHAGDILLHGHTHVPAREQHEGYVYLNPGSVSIPKNGTERGYMTFDGETFLWKTLGGESYMEYTPRHNR